MSGLTTEDRELIEVSTALFGWATQAEAIEATIKATEALVVRHVAAALYEAAGEIDKVRRTIEADLANPRTDSARGFRNGAQIALSDAARIVRKRADASP